MKIVPSIFDSFKIIAAQSTRKGGVSGPPFNSLNLGKSTNDSVENVIQNRKLFFDSVGVPHDRVAMSKQVHGTSVLLVNEPIITEGYDAMISNTKNVFLAVSIADCTPILIYDKENNAVAAVHAGWRGTKEGIVSNALKEMKAHFNTKGENCFAFIGACISFDSFEVGEEVALHFQSNLKRQGTVGKYYIDLKEANRNQLIEFGIPVQNIEVSDFCTVANNESFFSHRKEKGITGRMLAVIGII